MNWEARALRAEAALNDYGSNGDKYTNTHALYYRSEMLRLDKEVRILRERAQAVVKAAKALLALEIYNES